MNTYPMRLPAAVADAWRAEARQPCLDVAARQLAQGKRRDPSAWTSIKIHKRDHAWLQSLATITDVKAGAALALALAAFTDSCRLAAGDVVPLAIRWRKRRDARSRQAHYEIVVGIRESVIFDLSPVQEAFGCRSRGEAVALAVYVCRNLPGEAIACVRGV